MSADKTALQGVTKAIAFIDNRPDIHNLFIGSTVNGTTITFPKSIYMGWLPLEIRSIQLHPMRIKLFFTPSTWGGLPAGGGMSTFSIGIQLANDIPFTGYSIKMGRSLMVRKCFKFSNLSSSNGSGQCESDRNFSYTVNGGAAKSERTGLHYLESMWVTKWLSLQQQ